MAEESGEPSDGMTQPSREKPQWGTMLRQWGTILWQWCLGSWQWALFLLLRLSGFLLLLKVVWSWLSTVLPQWGGEAVAKAQGGRAMV